MLKKAIAANLYSKIIKIYGNYSIINILLNYYLLFSRSRPLALGYEKSGTGAEQNIAPQHADTRPSLRDFCFDTYCTAVLFTFQGHREPAAAAHGQQSGHRGQHRVDRSHCQTKRCRQTK